LFVRGERETFSSNFGDATLFATSPSSEHLKMLETVRSRQIYGFAVLTILPGPSLLLYLSLHFLISLSLADLSHLSKQPAP
jgi:hypothetical protein